MKEARNMQVLAVALALAVVMLKARMKVARNMHVLAFALAVVMLKTRMKEARNMQVLALALALALVMLKARMKVARNMQVLALALALALALVMLKASADVGSIITPSLFEQMLKHRNDAACKEKGFYSHNAFIMAARSFPAFGTTGKEATRKREPAAFFGQTSHETTGGWDSAPDGRYAWGYCFVREGSNTASSGYYGRGPIQLTHDYNYAQAGGAIGADLVRNPDLVATDAVISFKTAIWFWMTAQDNKPSSHDVITNRWTPSAADTSAGRVPGYGVITNIINGGWECAQGRNDKVEDRIGFYKRYCDMMQVGYGNNLDCYNQRPFA